MSLDVERLELDRHLEWLVARRAQVKDGVVRPGEERVHIAGIEERSHHRVWSRLTRRKDEFEAMVTRRPSNAVQPFVSEGRGR